MNSGPRRAVVLAGGYLTNPASYGQLVDQLQAPPYDLHVELVQANLPMWLFVRDRDFRPVADQIAAAVERARQASDGAPVTIVGHSAGGFISRIFLGDQPYNGTRYDGYRHVQRLITLGSPHLSKEFFTRRAVQWVNSNYPGAYIPTIEYVTVAGRAICGNLRGSWRERLVYMQYRVQTGNGAEWGDGVVPVAVAHLEGAHQHTLNDIQHVQGQPGGYDSPEALEVWGTYLRRTAWKLSP